MESARTLSWQLGHRWVGTEHLLLALIRDDSTIAGAGSRLGSGLLLALIRDDSTIPARVLRARDVDYALAQRRVLQLINGEELSS